MRQKSCFCPSYFCPEMEGKVVFWPEPPCLFLLKRLSSSVSLQSSRNPFLCSLSSQAALEPGTKILLMGDVGNLLLLPQLTSKLEINAFCLCFSMTTVLVSMWNHYLKCGGWCCLFSCLCWGFCWVVRFSSSLAVSTATPGSFPLHPGIARYSCVWSLGCARVLVGWLSKLGGEEVLVWRSS